MPFASFQLERERREGVTGFVSELGEEKERERKGYVVVMSE